jgi:hypothetical protein
MVTHSDDDDENENEDPSSPNHGFGAAGEKDRADSWSGKSAHLDRAEGLTL